MASTLIDLAIMTPSSAFGTSSTIPLGTAATVDNVTYLSFANAGATGGQQVSYSLLDAVNGGSEIGVATYTSSNVTLTSRTPTKSTNGSSFINASSGTLILGTVRGEDLNSFIVAGQLLGTATNDDATTGNVGEYPQVTLLSSQAVALTTGTAKNINSVALTAGDFDLWINARFTGGSATTITRLLVSISTTSSAIDSNPGRIQNLFMNGQTPFGTTTVDVMAGPTRIVSSVAITVNFVVQADFGSSNCSVYGIVQPRRRR